MLPLVLLLRTIKLLNQTFSLNALAKTLRLLWKGTLHAEGGLKRWQHLFWNADNIIRHATYAMLLTCWYSKTDFVILKSHRCLPQTSMWLLHHLKMKMDSRWTSIGLLYFHCTLDWCIVLIINKVKIIFFMLTGAHWQLSTATEISIVNRK